MKHRLFYLFIFAFILSSCAAKPTIVSITPLPLMKAPEPLEILSSDPADFEKSIPSSSILKKSLFVFENTYPRLYSDDGVKAAAAGEKMLADLKEDSVGFTMPYCPSLVTGGSYEGIKVDGYTALVYGKTDIALFSAEECVRYARYKRILKGGVAFLGERIAEWEGSKAILRKTAGGDIIFNGETGLAIAAAGLINGETVLVHYNGYITYYDVKAKAFAFKGSFPIEFEQLNFSEGKFYGIEKGAKKFFIITEKESVLTNLTGCVLSSSAPYALCGETLAGLGKTYDGLPKAENFTANGSFFADIKGGNLNIYSLQNSWQRFLRLDFDLPNPCMDKAGDIYFTAFDGASVKYSNGVETFVENRPDKCDSKAVKIKNGGFLCKNKPCGVFAEKIITQGLDTMFRRIEKGKRYYFFNELSPVDKVH